MPFSPLWPFLEKSLIVAVLQRNARLCACRLKNLRQTKNGLLTDVVQSHKLTSMDSPSQTLYLVQRRIEPTTKPLSEFRFGMSIPSRSPDEITPSQNLNCRHSISLTDAGGPRLSNSQQTWPARIRSSDFVRLLFHNHHSRHSSVKSPSEVRPAFLAAIIIR